MKIFRFIFFVRFIFFIGLCISSSLPSPAQEQAATAIDLPETRSMAEDLDSITEPAIDLDEFVISVRKESLHTDGANLTYDLESDDSTNGQSLLDVLRRMPMITVDDKDKIYIKGSSDIKILVNGVEDSMMEANAAQIFKAMPADAVARIEVLTEPGAKYDAEGTGGILNLITERTRQRRGASGAITAALSSQMYSANLMGSLKSGNVNADVSVNYADNNGLGQVNIPNSEIIDYTSQDAYLTTEDGHQKFFFRFLNADLKMSWQPNSSNLFTWGGSWMGMKAKIDDFTSNHKIYSLDNQLTKMWTDFTTGDMSNSGATANASWRHNFDEAGHKIILAYAFNFSKNALDTRQQVGDSYNYQYPNLLTTNNTSNYTRSHTIQLDYSNPFGGRTHLLETGFKGIFRHNSAFGYTQAGNSETSLLPVASDDVDASQIQNILALYASYTGNFGSWSLKGGLRYEHTHMGMDFHSGNYTDFRSDLDDVVPNASVSYSFSPMETLRLAYQMRISRPGIDQLNPYIFVLGNQVRQGNPDLESEHNNTISLSYSNFGRIIGATITASYIQANNTIQSFIDYRNGYLYQSYGNFGHSRRAELTGFINFNISNKMQLIVNGGVDYTDISDSKSGIGNHGWGGNYNVNLSYSGPADVKFGAYGGQNIHMINISGYFSGWYYYGLSISRDFLREKNLNLSLNANNFLTKYTHYKSVSFGDGWRRTDKNRSRNWNVGLTLTWRFGKLQERVKETGLDISSDDVSTKSGKQGSGISL